MPGPAQSIAVPAHTRPPAPRAQADARLGLETRRSMPRPGSATAARGCTPSWRTAVSHESEARGAS